MYLLRDHSPRFKEASAAATRRASANISASECSAAATALPPGALTTTMPRAVAAATSIVSTPAPARPITRSRGAESSSALVTRVSLRTSRASAWPRCRSRDARSPVTTSMRACGRKIGQTRAGELRQLLVAGKQLVEALGTHHLQRGLQAKEQAQRRSPWCAALVGGPASLLPVEIEPGQRCRGLSLPGAWRDRQECQARRD